MLKKITCFMFLIGICVSMLQGVVSAESPVQGYTYNSWSQSVSAPNTYECTEVLQGTDFGTTRFTKPADLFYDEKADELVILDSTRLVITDGRLKLKKEINEFISGQGPETLNNPSGVYVDDTGLIYIADTDNNRVLMVDPDQEQNVVEILRHDSLDINGQIVPFRPIKVVKDDTGNLYVLSIGCYLGAVIFDSGRQFVGFYGSNKVEATLNVLTDYIWKKITSKAQQDALAKYVPVEYTSFDIGQDKFIYTCTNTTQTGTEQVRKLNTMGVNILKGQKIGNNIDTSKFGDNELGNASVATNFSDICVDGDGYLYVLDQTQKKAFWYSKEGELIGTFGTRGSIKGTFMSATAIETIGNRALVLDADSAAISVFKRTEFGDVVAKAFLLYNDGQYEAAMEPWNQVLAMCPNFLQAYTSIGKALYNSKEYTQAMSYFKLAYNRTGYSNAYKEYRTAQIRQYAGWGLLVVVVVLMIIVLLVKSRKRFLSWYDRRTPAVKDRVAKLSYPFRLMRHTADNFEVLKVEKESSVLVSIGLLFLFFVCNICNMRYKGFIFNTQNAVEFNVLLLLASTIGVFLLWCICNYAVTTLLNGKGKFRHIFMTSVYSLTPVLCAMAINIVLSWFLTAEEGVFMTWILYVGILWAAVMLVKGLAEIHEYSGGQIVLSIVLTVFAMAAVVILGILMFSLISQFVSFIESIIVEVSFRYF